MDKTIRKNNLCVIGLPRCDFVFSSTRTCFIAYGFEESPIEKGLIKKLLEERGIQAVEAGGSFAAAQNAYCAKICSKIITSQFCVVLLNNEEKGGKEIPNANVNMEYGLMLGFNKYVIPFQKASQKLLFNVAGLDTIKYSDADFERKAVEAIDQGIIITNQEESKPVSFDQVLDVFLLTKKALITPLNSDGDKNIYHMGAPLGFNLLNDFSGLTYIYFGNFAAYRPEVVIWRLKMLKEILDERRSSMGTRVSSGLITTQQSEFSNLLFRTIQIWVLLTSDEDKRIILDYIEKNPMDYVVQIYSLEDARNALDKLVPSV